MKIGIHYRENSFSSYWIDYCKKMAIDFKVVNCYASDIINQTKDCDIVLFHWVQWNSKDILLAKQILYSLEQAGKLVYPDIHTCLLFDDKVGQKYISEAMGLPLVPSYVFYSESEALKWVNTEKFPKVFKLRGGAAASNIKLVNSRKHARKLIRKAFRSGFSPSSRTSNLHDRFINLKKLPTVRNFIHFCKGIIRLFFPSFHDRMRPREKAYVLFQDFIEDQTFDIRVVVIGNRAFGIKRNNRKNDFRASGSGDKEYDKNVIAPEYIKLAFDLNAKLKMQSVAFDFIGRPDHIRMIEFSYTWALDSFGKHPGYWDNNLNWIEGKFIPADFIIKDLIKLKIQK